MNEKTSKSDEGGARLDTDSAATSGAIEIVARKRGRPVGSGKGAPTGSGGGGAISGENETARRAEMQAQIDRLYDPEAWQGIVTAPANIALAVTGSDVWKIEKDEARTLAIQASATARCFMVSDPKWLALTMLSISIITIYGGRTMQYFAEKNAAERAAGNPAPSNV
jgi:hypothetical protein